MEELQHINEQSLEIVKLKEPHTHWRRNEDFHRQLCSYCGNRYLQQSLDTSLNICTRISNEYFTKLWSESRLSDAMNHVALVEVLEAGDLARAKEILAEDVESFKNEIL